MIYFHIVFASIVCFVNAVTGACKWQHSYSQGLLLVLERIVTDTHMNTLHECDVALSLYHMKPGYLKKQMYCFSVYLYSLTLAIDVANERGLNNELHCELRGRDNAALGCLFHNKIRTYI